MIERHLGLRHLTLLNSLRTLGCADRVGSHQHHGCAVKDGLEVHEDGGDARQLLQKAHQYCNENRPVHTGFLDLCPRHSATLEHKAAVEGGARLSRPGHPVLALVGLGETFFLFQERPNHRRLHGFCTVAGTVLV